MKKIKEVSDLSSVEEADVEIERIINTKPGNSFSSVLVFVASLLVSLMTMWLAFCSLIENYRISKENLVIEIAMKTGSSSKFNEVTKRIGDYEENFFTLNWNLLIGVIGVLALVVISLLAIEVFTIVKRNKRLNGLYEYKRRCIRKKLETKSSRKK